MTVYDIAAAAGTSVSTVSRVMNGSALIADGTRTAVLEAADRLGYTQRRVRRPAARSVLNIVVFLPCAAEPHAHLFYDAAALFAGIQTGLGAVRAHTIAALNGSTSPFEGKKLGDIDGCVFAFSEPSEDVRELLSTRLVPTVLINRVDDRFACVANDHAAGMASLASHLARRRPQARPVFLSVATAQPVARYRWEALRAGSELDLSDADHYEFSALSAIDTEAIGSLLARGYDAFICVYDLVSGAVHDRLGELGVAVPEKVALTGYDAAPVRGLLSRAITTVDLAVERLGHEAAAQLVDAVLSRSMPTGCAMIPGEFIAGTTV